jgi:hypothetical protein
MTPVTLTEARLETPANGGARASRGPVYGLSVSEILARFPAGSFAEAGSMRALLESCVALGLVVKSEGRYRLSAYAEAHFGGSLRNLSRRRS